MTPASTESGAGPLCIYLYCLYRGEVAWSTTGARLGGGLIVVQEGEVTAAVEPVMRAEFSDEKLADPKGILDKLKVHEEVIEEAMGADSVLPFRFATLFSSVSVLKSRLAEHRAQLEKTLDHLGHREEWGVELTVKPSAPANPSGGPAGASGPSASPGASFLRAKSAAWERRQDRREEAAALTDRVFRALAQESADSRTVSGGGNKAVFLVPRDRRQAFRSAVHRLADSGTFDGVQFRVTGPWPAYHFCEQFPMEVGRG